MADEPKLQHALLEHLQQAPLSRAELARRTGASERRVQAALDELIHGTFVARRPQDDGPADYELTENGAGRLRFVADLVDSPASAMGKVYRALAVESWRMLRGKGSTIPGQSGRALFGVVAVLLSPFLLIVFFALFSGAKASNLVIYFLLVGGMVVWKYHRRDRGSRQR